MGTETVFARKKELILRDPLYKELCETLERIHRARKSDNDKRCSDDLVFEEVKERASPRCSEKMRKAHEARYPDHWALFKLIGAVEYKWRVTLGFKFSPPEITIDAPYVDNSTIYIGTVPYIEGYEGVILSDPDKYPMLNWVPYPNPFGRPPELADINEFVNRHYNKTGRTWLPIVVNVSELNKTDAKKTKRQLWSVIEAHLQKEKRIPYLEDPACRTLYRFRKGEIFQNYLRWYDLHTWEKPRLGFRLIAFLEEKHKDGMESYDDWLQALRTTKWKVSRPVKGEDRVEKGVKRMWAAIHREPYTQKKVAPLMEEWSCPVHGRNVQTGSTNHPGQMRRDGSLRITCPHCKALYDRFNRFHSVDSGWTPTDTDKEIDRKVLKASGRLPKKQTRYHDEDIDSQQ
jgi:hypothetical protein